jgi:hypothetical protein
MLLRRIGLKTQTQYERDRRRQEMGQVMRDNALRVGLIQTLNLAPARVPNYVPVRRFRKG